MSDYDDGGEYNMGDGGDEYGGGSDGYGEYNDGYDSQGSGGSDEYKPGIDDDEDDPAITIENMIYEAKDLMDEEQKYKEAIPKLREAIELDKKQDSQKFTLDAWEAIIECDQQTLNKGDIKNDVEEMLAFFTNPEVSENNRKTQLKNIQLAIRIFDPKLQLEINQMVLDYLEKNAMSRLMIDTALALANTFLQTGNFNKLDQMIDKIKSKCYNPDGTEMKSRSQQILKLYALQINVAFRQNDNKQVNIIYKKIKRSTHISNADSKTKAILFDIQGRKQLEEGDYENAERTFYKAFENLQGGDHDKQINMLKYVGIAAILGKTQVNLYQTQEAAVNLKNKTIHNINELRKACDENNITEFRKILYLKNTHIQDDDMVVGLTEELMKVISLQTIEGLIASYRRVTVKYLMDELNTSQDTIERYLAELILSGKIRGKINQTKGYFENEDLVQDKSELKSLVGINKWVNSIKSLSKA